MKSLDRLYKIYTAARLLQDEVMDFDDPNGDLSHSRDSGWEHDGPLSSASDLVLEVAAEIMRSERPGDMRDVRRIASTPGLPLDSFNGCFDLSLFEAGLRWLIDTEAGLLDPPVREPFDHLHFLLCDNSDLLNELCEYELIETPAELVEYLQGVFERQAVTQ